MTKFSIQEEELIEPGKLTFISLVSSLIFVFHPTQVESVVWVYSMRGVLASFFALVSIYTYLKFLDLKEKKYIIIASGAYIVGMLFKFSIAAIPATFILLDYFLDKKMTIKKSVMKHWIVLSFGVCFFFIFTYEYTSEYVSGLKISNLDAIFIMLRTSSHYIKKLIYPFHYSLDYGLNFKTYKSFLPNVWQSRLSVLAVVMMNIYSLRVVLINGKNSYVFCYLFFVILMFPGLGLIPHDFQYSSFVADRYLYLGVVPLCLLAAIVTVKMLRIYPAIFPFVPAIIIGGLLITCFNLVRLWGDSEELFYKSYMSNINSDMLYEGMIAYYDKKNDLEKINYLMWLDTKKQIKHRQSYIEFVKYLGQSKRVRDGLITIEAWKQTIDFVDVLYFYLYLEAKLFSYAEKQLEVISKLNPEKLRPLGITVNELRAMLEKSKKEAPAIFSPWEQMTRLKYKPLSERLRAEMERRGYLPD